MVSTKVKLGLCFSLFSVPTAVLSHEFWLEPVRSQVTTGDEIIVSIRVGEDLVGDEIPNLPHLQEAVDLSIGADRFSIASRIGDIPAFKFLAQEDALIVLRYQSKPNPLIYDSDDAFMTFLDEAQRPDLLKAWKASHQKGSKITEEFTRYAKTAIGIGNAFGQDMYQGMPFEIVMLENPFSDSYDGSLSLRLMRDGRTARNAPYHILFRDELQQVSRVEGHTDDNGLFTVSTVEQGFYLVNAIDVAETDPATRGESGVQWKSNWASLSFRIE